MERTRVTPWGVVRGVLIAVLLLGALRLFAQTLAVMTGRAP